MKSLSLAVIIKSGALISLLLTGCASTDQKTAAGTVSEIAAQTSAKEDIVDIPSRPFPAESFYDLLVAEFAVRRSRYDLALGNYLQQAYQTQDPGVAARATRLAQFLKADKATLDAAQLWITLEPTNAEAQYTAANMLAKNKRPLEALEHMRLVLENGGTTNFTAIAANALSLPNTTHPETEQAFDQLLQQYPLNTQIIMSKALFLQQRDESKQALTLIQQVLELNPKDLHAVVVEARLLQQLKRDDQVFIRLEQTIDQNPFNRRLRLQYARMLMNDNIELAKKQFEILLEQAPADPDLLLSLGLISKETDNSSDAQTYFQRLLASGKRNTDAHYYLGQLEEHQQHWTEAIEHYKHIPPGNDFLAAINRITAIYNQIGQSDEALEHLKNIRKQYPDDALRLYLLESEILLRKQEFEQGNNLLTEALLIHPKQASLLYARSLFSEKRNNLTLMEQDLRQIIEQDANSALALNALGYVLATRTDRLDEAHQLINQALTLKPNDAAIQDSLGWVEYRRGNLTAALELLQQAYKAFPDPEVAAHLGEVLWQLNRREEAIQLWQQALKKAPNNLFVIDTIKRLDVNMDSQSSTQITPNSQ